MSISSLNLLTTFAMAKHAYRLNNLDSHYPTWGGGGIYLKIQLITTKLNQKLMVSFAPSACTRFSFTN